MEINEKRAAAIFKAFCDENRIRILKQLRTGEKCACVLLDNLQITQPTLSHHMKILCDADIVISRKEGNWYSNTLSQNGGENAVACLKALTDTTLSNDQ